MTTELVVREAEAIAQAGQPSSGLALSFAEMAMRVRQLDQFYSDVMQDGTDYGVIPGTGKPSLFQPGAQMLDQIFGLVPSFEVVPASVIDWQRPIPFFHYMVRCRLLSRRSGELVAEAIGSCNTHEDRYRWRQSKKVCPKCGIEAIGRSKQEFGGGYYCNAKQGGCGGRYRPNSREAADLDAQQAGRVENEDTASLENTVLKMAQKRAHVAATLNATGASRIFTQDVEDLPGFQVVESISRPSPAPEPVAEPTDRPQTATRRAPQPTPEPASEELERATRMTGTPIKQSRAAMVKSLGFRMQHARQLGLDPAEQDADAMSDEDLAETLTALTAQITAAQATKTTDEDEDTAF